MRKKMQRLVADGVHDELYDSSLLQLFLAVAPDQRRKLPLVCKGWNRVCQSNNELWAHVQVSLGADFLQSVDVSALYRWFLARAGAVQHLEFEIDTGDCWTVICGVLGIVGRNLHHLRVYAESEGCYEAGGRAAWLALVPNLMTLEVENAADWTMGVAARFPPSLTRLELSYCGEEGLPAVPKHLPQLPALVSLSLQGSQLDSRVAVEPLQYCKHLQRINLSDSCLLEVPTCLSALSGLTALTLNCNPKLGGEDNEERVAPLAELRGLQLLEMRDCALTCVPISVTGLTSLRTLLLAMNAMTSEPHFLPPGPYLERLALLGLSDCFGEEEAGYTLEKLVAELEGARGLEVLRINRNWDLQLNTQGLHALLRGKPKLRRLDFSREMAAPDLDFAALQSEFPGVQFVYNYS